MKKIMGNASWWFVTAMTLLVIIAPISGNADKPTPPQKDAVCPSGQSCQCVSCPGGQSLCSSTAQGCADEGCLQACSTAVPDTPLYSIVGQGVIYYCLENKKINPVTDVPPAYQDQEWYTCGPSMAYPTSSPPPTPLHTSYAAYSISPGAVFSCPQGESPQLPHGAPPNSGWFTCAKNLIEEKDVSISLHPSK